MKKPGIIFLCWLWYALAQLGDMVTSLPIWGGIEQNPFFRDAFGRFVASHAFIGKGVFTAMIAFTSYVLYKLLEPLDKRIATIVACVLPLYYAFQIWGVVSNNFFMIMRWVHF